MYAILRVDTEWCELSILSNNGRKNHKDFGSKYVKEVFFLHVEWEMKQSWS